MEKGEKIKTILRKNKDGLTGLTITDLVKKSKFSRSTVIKVLSKLEGASKISFKKIGMAKIYSLNKGKRKNNKNAK